MTSPMDHQCDDACVALWCCLYSYITPVKKRTPSNTCFSYISYLKII